MFRKEQIMDLAPRVCNERLPENSKNITILCFFCSAATQLWLGFTLVMANMYQHPFPEG